MRFLTPITVLSLLCFAVQTPTAEAAYGGITAAANWQQGQPHLGRHAERCGLRCRAGASVCEDDCYTIMKTTTRIVYDRVTEQREMVVYDTVWEKQCVQDVKQVAEVQSRVEQFTYQRPVYETITQQVPYTVQRPYVETRTCDVAYTSYARSFETRVHSVPYTVYNTVCEATTRTVHYRVPRQVCGTKTIQVRSGHWETRIIEYPRVAAADPRGAQKTDAGQKAEPCQKDEPIRICRRVWVPCIETREVPYTTTVYELETMEVPHMVKRIVPEVRTRDVEYTVCRMVPVTQTRTVSYQVLRSIPEHRMRTVTGVIEKQVTEVGTRTVPYTTIREVPVTRTVTVPRQVPRTVICTVVRTVPRQETCQIPVRICVPTKKCDPGKKGEPGKKGSDDGGWDGDVPKPVLDSSPASERPASSTDNPDRSA